MTQRTTGMIQRRLQHGSPAFTVLLGALAALPPLSIDLNLPALPELAAWFAAPPEAAAATLSAFTAAFALTQLVYGPASDRFGRRPVLMLGLAVYAAAGLACALAPSLPALVAWRAVQGAGAGAGMVLARAIVRDLFPDPAAARAQFSYLSAVVAVAPVAAPLLGSLLLTAGGGWRPLFAVLALAGAALLIAVWAGLDESVPARDRGALRPARLLASYGRFLGLRECLGNALVAGCVFGCLFGFVSGSPLVFVAALGFGPAAYAATFAGVSACIIAGSFAAAALARRGVPARGAVRAALAGICVGSAAGAAALSAPASLPTVSVLVPSLAAVAFCFGLAMPTAIQGALQPVPDMAGAGAAVLGCMQMLGATLSSASVGTLFGPLGAAAMPAVMVASALAALAVHETVLRPARRVGTDKDGNQRAQVGGSRPADIPAPGHRRGDGAGDDRTDTGGPRAA